MSIETIIARIQPLDQESMAAARARQDALTKPQGSLGRLEALSIQVAGITRQPRPRIRHKVVTVMAGSPLGHRQTSPEFGKYTNRAIRVRFSPVPINYSTPVIPGGTY